MVVIIVNEQQHLRSRLNAAEVQLTVHLLRVQGNLFKFAYD